MNKNTLQFLKSRHFIRGSVIIGATIIMHFAPDYIDEVIKILLVSYGVMDIQHANHLAEVAKD